MRYYLYVSILGVALTLNPFHFNSAWSQVSEFESDAGVQRGIGVKVLASFSTVEKLNYRIGLIAGFGGYLGDKRWLYPAFNTDLMLFGGGMGSPSPGIKSCLNVEWIVSYLATIGCHDRLNHASSSRPEIRNYPLYYFNNWSHPSLQNPFEYSVSLGGNVVFFITKYLRPSRQMVGFLNLHASRLQASYANDGPPFRQPFGDRFDRYHTGAGYVSFHGDNDWEVNLIELGYNKFTGYSHSSYEISNQLGNAYVFYEDENQNFFNKTNFYLNAANLTRHLGLAFSVVNFPWVDIQHSIHLARHFPLHMVPYNGGFEVGLTRYYQLSKVGMQ